MRTAIGSGSPRAFSVALPERRERRAADIKDRVREGLKRALAALRRLDREQALVKAEADRLEMEYGPGAYLQTWFVVEEMAPYTREVTFMEKVLVELLARRGARSAGDMKTLAFHRDVNA